MAGMPIGSINLRLLKSCAGFKKQNCSIMKKIFLLIQIIISVAAIHSCKEPPPEPGSTPTSSQVDVYVAGYEGDHYDGGVAKYWKNGQAISIPLTDGSTSAVASSIAVVGSDVYVAGYDSWDFGTYNRAKYWKNGIPVNLTIAGTDAAAWSIAVVGGDVYVAGGEGINISVAKYWKNGQAVPLNDWRTSSARATSIAVVGSDVYVAGFELTSFNSGGMGVAKYWKNGQAVPLTSGSSLTFANSIVVVGSDVYVAGGAAEGPELTDGYGNVYRNLIAKYWKNGQVVSLTDGTNHAKASSIAIVSNDVYVAGYEGSSAKYWKNGQAISLTDGTNAAVANSIAVVGSDVYVAGFEWNGSNYVAKYWKNGQAKALSDGTKDVRATSIVVVNR
jgi:hypothetical protein